MSAENSEKTIDRTPSRLSVAKDRPSMAMERPSTAKSATVNEKDAAPTPKLKDGDFPPDKEGGVVAPAPGSKILRGRKLALAFTGMLLSIFLIALDQTIIAPALPVIASHFQALDELSWIASAYFLTQCAFLTFYGQALTIFERRMVYCVAIFWFELGSLLCGVAPNMIVLIVGRAIAGVGAAGIFISVLAIIADVTRLEDRPLLFGLFGAVFAISSVAGPLLGGAFTDRVSWRWCFYINLPIGALTILAIVFILPRTPPTPFSEATRVQVRRKIKRWMPLRRWKVIKNEDSFFFKAAVVDYVGTVLLLGLVTLLVLALQWGGTTYAWKDSRIIGMFCGFGGLLIVFVLYEKYVAGELATIPLRYFKYRTQVGASLVSMFSMLVLLQGTYYLPYFYEAVKRHKAEKAGIDILPFMLSIVISAAAAGGIVTAVGRYWWIMLFGPWISAIGGGLMFTITPDTSNAKLIGFQILVGIGVGMVLQNGVIAVQADCKDPEDVPQRSALLTLMQLMGGVIGIAIASNIFNNQLVTYLELYAPSADIAVIKLSTDAIWAAPPQLIPDILKAYVRALDDVYIIAVPAAILTSASVLLIRNHNVRDRSLGAAAV